MRGSISEPAPLACLSVRLVSSAQVVPLLHAAGFRALYVDLQHASMSAAAAAEIAAEADRSGMVSFIRTSGPHVPEIMSLAFLGVRRILVPGADSAEQASLLLQELPQQPQLRQGWCKEFELGLMVESVASVSDIDAIVKQPNLRFVMIGCTDLAKDAKKAGITDARYISTSIQKVAFAAKRANVDFMVGGTWRSKELMDAALAAKPVLITVGSDLLLLQHAAGTALERFAAATPFCLAQPANALHKGGNDH
ncbi:MAG TPA: aldolase/citrate lyase family protein [Noviherbaspirillum sp.]|nr:aldolase/citrate lyase family protein [Noviherbaspirillum sp.]